HHRRRLRGPRPAVGRAPLRSPASRGRPGRRPGRLGHGQHLHPGGQRARHPAPLRREVPLVPSVPLVHVPILAVTITDATVFAVSAAVIVAGAIGVIAARNPVHSALMLVMTLFGIAVLFVEQSADFLAVVQVIVYAGAIVVLFLFVIMLLGVDRLDVMRRDPLPGQRPLVLVIGAAGLSLLLFLAGVHWATGARSVAGPSGGAGSNVDKLARSIFTTYLLPLEVTSVL